MSRLDLVIFGATGFTGRYAVEEQVRISQQDKSLAWGVAGRSKAKLDNLLQQISDKTGEDLSKVHVIVADVNDEDSLKTMTAQTKVVANCAGPYRHFGEQVVRACIATKTHHVDVSGEPEFIESMHLKYGKAAEEAGVYVVSACGFDSIPNDMGVVYLQQNFPGTLNSVESYLTSDIDSKYRQWFTTLIHYGTWASLVDSLSNWDQLTQLRKQLYPEKLPVFKPVLKQRFPLHKHDDQWFIPFLGADKSIVYRTQRYFYENDKKRPVQFRPYFGFPNLLTAILTIFVMGFVFLMTKTSFTKKLLLDYPKLFSFGCVSHEGPTEESMKNTTFKVTLEGEGWDESVKDVANTKPNKKMVAKVSGVNPGYGATVVALLHCGLTIIKEGDKMPGKGGVLTSGVAYANTSLIQTLQENNFNFAVVKE